MEAVQDKEVWYLDQSFISNLAKAHDQLLPAGDPHYEIYEEMRRAVREDAIICPESEYHYLEALLDSRLIKRIRKASRWLSWGVAFKEHQEVIIAQALVALREVAQVRLGALPPPLGFGPRAKPRRRRRGDRQHQMGPDPPARR